MPPHLYGYYGAPARVWTLFEFSKTAAHLNLSVSTFNKTTTRLPEAQWVDFEVAVPAAAAPAAVALRVPFTLPAPPQCESWTVAKLGSTFCATDVSLFGSTHIHAVSDADRVHGSVSISAGETVFRLTTLDAALLSLEYKTAFPNPVCRDLDVGLKAENAYVCLSNNFWTTNCKPPQLSLHPAQLALACRSGAIPRPSLYVDPPQNVHTIEGDLPPTGVPPPFATRFDCPRGWIGVPGARNEPSSSSKRSISI